MGGNNKNTRQCKTSSFTHCLPCIFFFTSVSFVSSLIIILSMKFDDMTLFVFLWWWWWWWWWWWYPSQCTFSLTACHEERKGIHNFYNLVSVEKVSVKSVSSWRWSCVFSPSLMMLQENGLFCYSFPVISVILCDVSWQKVYYTRQVEEKCNCLEWLSFLIFYFV